ncbi:large ribosomal subunit protein P1-like isoform X2 [Desmodus rotundus]|uniref:large ribosomal subunit protein P1-like isoform X2 n=1 Tax=Desmodus rotundus TaxID=9430 RepID=UPI002380F022|nr:60S acidic ribosomal protein P1-like isoform X2 [Desmodus rotundus]
MATVSQLIFICLALILHEVTVTALANVNIRSLIVNVGAGGPAIAANSAPEEGPDPTTAAPAKKEESEESDDDTGFGLFD